MNMIWSTVVSMQCLLIHMLMQLHLHMYKMVLLA